MITGHKATLSRTAFRRVSSVRIAQLGGLIAAAFALMNLSAGCGTTPPGVEPGTTTVQATVTRDLKVLAARYLLIAVPANHRLDAEVGGFTRHERTDLPVAELDLREEATTERWFDKRLLKIRFPPAIAAIARALVEVNQKRAELTDLQAGSPSVARLRSFDLRHYAADAAVEIEVRIIRRDLGLPPPATS
jgi:hypothetical protein